MATLLSRRFRADVTSDIASLLAAPGGAGTGWIELKGMNDFDPEDSPNLEDASAYDTNGYGSMEKTFSEWSATATVLRRSTGGVADPGQELVRLKLTGAFGDASRVGLRWYDKSGQPEAFQGIAIVGGYKRAATGVKNLDAATITFTGTDIPLTPIANPAWPRSPRSSSRRPRRGRARGQLVTISGAGFTGTTGATGVKFGGVNATNYQVVSDQTIVATLPTGSAGSAPIIVTNGVGASTAFPYTRAA